MRSGRVLQRSKDRFDSPMDMAYYLAERFHQGIGGQIIRGEARATNDSGTGTAIVRRSRIGGFLNYYCREAA